MTPGPRSATVDDPAVAGMADAMLAAYAGAPVASLPLGEGTRGADTAHAVRRAMVDHWISAGRRVAGRKIGLTSAELRERLGAPQPTDGFLFADMMRTSGSTIDRAGLYRPLAEVELALIVAHDILTVPAGHDETMRSISAAVAAIEIADTRIADWRIDYAHAIADNGSAACFATSVESVAVDACADARWTMDVSGGEGFHAEGVVDLGEVLGNFRWLCGTAIAAGMPLRQGEIILTGSLGKACPIAAGQRIAVAISGVGMCSLVFR